MLKFIYLTAEYDILYPTYPLHIFNNILFRRLKLVIVLDEKFYKTYEKWGLLCIVQQKLKDTSYKN